MKPLSTKPDKGKPPTGKNRTAKDRGSDPTKARAREFLEGKSREKSRPAGSVSQPRSPVDLPPPDKDMQRFRIEVGLEHGVKPANIVGAIANEAELDSEYIGRIEIYQDHSTVDLPEGMPKELFKHLKKVRVSGQRLDISRVGKDSRVFAEARKGKRSANKGKPGKAAKSSPAKPRKRKVTPAE